MPLDVGKKAKRKRERKLLARFNRNSFVIHENEKVVVIATGFEESSSNGKTGAMIHTWSLRKDMNPFRAVKSGKDDAVCFSCPRRPSAPRKETTDYLEAQSLGWRSFTISDHKLVGQSVCPASHEAIEKARARHNWNSLYGASKQWRQASCETCLLCAGTSKHGASIQIKGHGMRKDVCYVRTSEAPLSIWRAYKKGRYARLIDLSLFRDRIVRFGAYGEPILIPLPIMRAIVGVSAGHTGYTHEWRAPWVQGYREFLMASTSAVTEA
jgi:hypothetical protein